MGCIIRIIDVGGIEYKVYRYKKYKPEEVISDIRIIDEKTDVGLEDPEIFLSNLIFYSMLTMYEDEEEGRKYRPWEYLYRICGNKDYNRFAEYTYIISLEGMEKRIEIYKHGFDKSECIFSGKLKEAYEKFKGKGLIDEKIVTLARW